MALNPFFLQGSQSEQKLVQQLINEQLRMYGVEVTYIPRKFVRKDTILNEIQSSKFDDNYAIEAYVNTYDGYSGAGDILTKFGVSIKDELLITISKERFEDFISPFLEAEDDDEIVLSSRPREGDLIYFPLGQRIFEVKFVEHEDPFYQLGRNYVYLLKCELFEYEDEVIDTAISEIDTQIKDEGFITTLKLIGIGATATASASINTGYVRQIFLNNDGSGYTSTPTITFSAAPVSGSTATAVAITTSRAGVRSIQEILLTNAGAGYTVAPTIFITGGNGIGAAATCSIETVQKGIISVSVDGGGSGYSITPSVSIEAPSAGAEATAAIGAGGTVTVLTITNPGAAYTATPTVTVQTPPTRTGVLSTSSLSASGSGYSLGSYNIIPYSGVTGVGGTSAIIEVTSVNGSGGITGFSTSYGGFGYSSSGVYYLFGGNNGGRIAITSVTTGIGTTAVVTATISENKVTALSITNPGSGYTTAPIVTISNVDSIKDSSLARAVIVAGITTGNIVNAIRIRNPGIGYTVAPPITVADPPLITGIGTYQFNEVVVGSTSGARARVKSWNSSSRELKISIIDGTFSAGEVLIGVGSSATYSVNQYDDRDLYDKYSQNDEIEEEADFILDFSQSNPFGSY
jgi:hypothetical protein